MKDNCVSIDEFWDVVRALAGDASRCLREMDEVDVGYTGVRRRARQPDALAFELHRRNVRRRRPNRPNPSLKPLLC